jgi:hypothetical protein
LNENGSEKQRTIQKRVPGGKKVVRKVMKLIKTGKGDEWEWVEDDLFDDGGDSEDEGLLNNELNDGDSVNT